MGKHHYFVKAVLSSEPGNTHQSLSGTPVRYWSRGNDLAPTISSEANIAPADKPTLRKTL